MTEPTPCPDCDAEERTQPQRTPAAPTLEVWTLGDPVRGQLDGGFVLAAERQSGVA